jgi:hypothetical protein
VQLVTVQARHPGQQSLALGQQVYLDHTAILPTGAARQPTQGRTAIHQRHDAMVLGLQALGEFPDRGPRPARKAGHVQQQLVLQRREPMRAAGELAGAQELTKPVPEVRQALEVALVQRFRRAGRWRLG